MIYVCKWANFTCCFGTCCAETEIAFGHASLWCSRAGFGLSVGNRFALMESWKAFNSAQDKFGKVERYALIPSVEDLARRGQGGNEQRTLVAQAPRSTTAARALRRGPRAIAIARTRSSPPWTQAGRGISDAGNADRKARSC
jgi:hypothetical protein